jgi:diadenosine tetraphosphate (Ap4A) HIT family hydrolase
MEFELHPQLQKDCFVLGRLALCRLLLMNDANYPWFILVPQKPGLRELHELNEVDQRLLLREVNAVSRMLVNNYSPDKINVAALGNVVPQLHVHVIGRSHKDPAWPAPVWGRVPARPYTPEKVDGMVMLLGIALADVGFKPVS